MEKLHSVLGEKVKDRVTGFKGVVVARCQYLWGCISLAIAPDALDDGGNPQDFIWMDEDRVDVLSKGGVVLDLKKRAVSGGPQEKVPSAERPSR